MATFSKIWWIDSKINKSKKRRLQINLPILLIKMSKLWLPKRNRAMILDQIKSNKVCLNNKVMKTQKKSRRNHLLMRKLNQIQANPNKCWLILHMIMQFMNKKSNGQRRQKMLLAIQRLMMLKLKYYLTLILSKNGCFNWLYPERTFLWDTLNVSRELVLDFWDIAS